MSREELLNKATIEAGELFKKKKYDKALTKCGVILNIDSKN